MGKLTKAQVEAICRRYEAGESSPTLGRAFQVSPGTIRGHVIRNGVVMRSLSEAKRKYVCDDGFFTMIDTEEKAYWLGFLAADGCVTREGRMLDVMLAVGDGEHLQRLLDALRSNYPIKMSARWMRSTGRTYGMVEVRIGSARLCADLIRHGVVPRKSLILEWPDLPWEMARHYLRGYVDGDGWFYARRRISRPSLALKFGVMGTRGFLEAAQSLLMAECDLGRTKLYRHGKLFKLLYGGRLQVSRIFHYLYDGATVWLPRKRSRVEQYILSRDKVA